MVVAHHSALAYTTWAFFNKDAYILALHPVTDVQRWIGLDIFVNFNDIFFMPLMFVIGGFFMVQSIERKGTKIFIKDRFKRLFLPFILLGTFFMLIAYFPGFYRARHSTNIFEHIFDFFVIEQWPVGPPWFIWVLFFLSFLFALFYALGKKMNWKLSIGALQNKPLLFCLAWVLLTWILYVPLTLQVGANTWTGFYPFDFQLNRAFLYPGYFLIGILMGDYGLERGLFSKRSPLVKNWGLLLLLALLVFIILTPFPEYLKGQVETGQFSQFWAEVLYYSLYPVSCTLSCLAFITIFKKKVTKERKWWNSLSDNAYMIYLIHFLFVTWVQFGLMRITAPALLKFGITFILSLALSWGASILLRRIPLIKRYI